MSERINTVREADVELLPSVYGLPLPYYFYYNLKKFSKGLPDCRSVRGCEEYQTIFQELLYYLVIEEIKAGGNLTVIEDSRCVDKFLGSIGEVKIKTQFLSIFMNLSKHSGVFFSREGSILTLNTSPQNPYIVERVDYRINPLGQGVRVTSTVYDLSLLRKIEGPQDHIYDVRDIDYGARRSRNFIQYYLQTSSANCQLSYHLRAKSLLKNCITYSMSVFIGRLISFLLFKLVIV